MPGLVPGIHAFATGATVCGKDVDGRAKPGHDEEMNPLFGSEHYNV
jgi:hypothetical protein